jgi:hypothetical protein
MYDFHNDVKRFYSSELLHFYSILFQEPEKLDSLQLQHQFLVDLEFSRSKNFRFIFDSIQLYTVLFLIVI